MTTSLSNNEPTFQKIVRLLRWHKPAGRLILMLPALWATVAASKSQHHLPPLNLLIVVILGSLATSAAGCVINDIWDLDIDPMVDRTKNRPLAERSLSIQVGIAVLLVSGLCAFLLSTYLNPLSFGLCFAAVPVIVIYPACKRFFAVPQLVLSIAWGFTVLIPWSAVTGGLDRHAWELWIAVIAWTMGFDTIYAMSDRSDDMRVGIKSSALFFGRYVTFAIAIFLAITLGCLVWLGFEIQLGYTHYFACLTSAVIWIWQCNRLNQAEIPSELYQKAFGQNVWIGFIILAGMLPSTLGFG
ncbi:MULTISPECIES: 4-hydroxybenzoate solanesyltransferase [Pseudanabaena]|uniref:4-hydroxybenzoate solanesyltransferase n=2 Tax=Pseudanabaena TaxID=1152 RepID=L8MRF1_9CYAN|nr:MULTISPECIES: 4-hydroxybenzoate solanesyltransferase [Pseudanabaena]ELS30492.1 4-hydroxybenzoate octaprenyltransferase [Pseudanabaena biceps PCC 7429]MDG3497236.1 4-hydroxybenzoate solanesyltransferase [Pseudanabaena catenata USMAC16]